MDKLDDILTQATELLSKLYGLPGGLLVLLSCLVVGYFLRIWKAFPNSAIPVVVVLWGPVFNMLIADPLADKLTIRIWLVKNFLVGVVIGGLAWLVHNKLLSRIEDKIPFLKGWLVPEEVSDDGKPTTTPADPAQPVVTKP